ncbi:MAG: biotin--[acetyl-CoA-carboxylase] ligase [Mariprofundales bacterium]
MIAPTPLQLPESRISWRHLALESVDSTNDIALRQADEGAAEGLVVTARSQRCGRGRLGRRWESGQGESLLMSVLLRPNWLQPQQAPELSLMAAVALYRALELPTARLKWPNDLLVGDCKLAGILTEMRTCRSDDCTTIDAVVVGIGLNLLPPAGGWSGAFRLPPTSLQEQGLLELRAERWLSRLLIALDCAYLQFKECGFAPLAEAWWQAHGEGRMVTVDDGTRCWQGEAVGLDNDGALMVRGEDGVQRVVSADVL